MAAAFSRRPDHAGAALRDLAAQALRRVCRTGPLSGGALTRLIDSVRIGKPDDGACQRKSMSLVALAKAPNVKAPEANVVQAKDTALVPPQSMTTQGQGGRDGDDATSPDATQDGSCHAVERHDTRLAWRETRGAVRCGVESNP